MKLFTTLAALFLAATTFAAENNKLALIPWPQKIQMEAGTFRLAPDTKIFADSGSLQTADQLAERLRPATGYPLAIETSSASSAIAHAILLTTKDAGANLGEEGYELSVTADSVVIRAPTQAGLFYGVQTLLQLLPPEIFSASTVEKADWQVPCVQIKDWPRFKWRGLMLDVSRHFYNKAEVEKILDEMSLYKLNTFHWHLVDDQGWRIEIKKYPRLTQIGAWRKQCDFEPPSKFPNAHSAWAEPSAQKFGPDGRYGGFYTQEDIREIVAYAAARHITIVPEIEMPGHSRAALEAYPQFGSGPGIYDPANPGTYVFLENILSEVFQLFPGKYIHIGGDEVQKSYWKNSADCQALMKREGLTNEDELQSWFTKRMEKFINSQGKTLIGWSEILKGGLATNAVVMDWIGGGLEAASAGHDVVMSPTAYCYFDHYQSMHHAGEPRAIGGYLPLQKVYSFDPIPASLPAQYHSYVLGAQGNLWTEYVQSLAHVQYMFFPRACALAEVVWSPKDSHNWDGFVQRLNVDEKRLNELGVNYRPGTSEPIELPKHARK